MSHQGEKGWFPKCLICEMGNIGCVVCLDPTCHEGHESLVIESAQEKYVDEGDHCWQLCQFCDAPVLSDPCSFGVYALCVGCWNAYAQAGHLPPASAAELRDHLASGVLRIELVQRGLNRLREIIVARLEPPRGGDRS